MSIEARPSLPPELWSRVCLENKILLPTARLGNHIVMVQDLYEGPAVLKYGIGRGGADIQAEAERLHWLGGRAQTPKLIESFIDDEFTYSLVKKVDGVPAHQATGNFTVEEVIYNFANCLNLVHKVDINRCPFPVITQTEYQAAKLAVKKDLIDRAAFGAEVGQTPENVLEQISPLVASVSEGYFTHGDYCLPNVIIDISGAGHVIDWGAAGISNRNRDFMSAELTITRNFGASFIPVFYEAYGPHDAEPELVKFYWLLDRFSHHLK